MHFTIADITCFHISALLRGFLVLFMLKFQQKMLLFMWHDLLFSGAKDDSVIFVSLCLCVSVGRIIGLERERVIALSAAPNALGGGGRVYCVFLHIFWLIVPISQGQWKEVRAKSQEPRIDHFKGKIHLQNWIYIVLIHWFLIVNLLSTNTSIQSVTATSMETKMASVTFWAVSQKLSSHPSNIIMHAIMLFHYSLSMEQLQDLFLDDIITTVCLWMSA